MSLLRLSTLVQNGLGVHAVIVQLTDIFNGGKYQVLDNNDPLGITFMELLPSFFILPILHLISPKLSFVTSQWRQSRVIFCLVFFPQDMLGMQKKCDITIEVR